MKHYFYADNDQQLGPFTIEELKSKRLKKSTLVWTEGMQNWNEASEIEDLKSFLISEPPPLPRKIVDEVNAEKRAQQKYEEESKSRFDTSYEKETHATVAGIFVLIVTLIISYTGVLNSINNENNAHLFLSIAFLATRILITVGVVNIANRLNRSKVGWGWFAFFSPTLALIIIGLLKKLKLKIQVNSNLSDNEQVEEFKQRANELFSDSRYSECIQLLNAALDIDKQEFKCVNLRGLSYFALKDYQNAKIDFEFLLESGEFLATSNFHLGCIALINKNRALAINYWLEAEKLGEVKVKEKLDQNYTYTGKYLLDGLETTRKIGSYSQNSGFEIEKSSNIGLPELDNVEHDSFVNSQVYTHEFGLHIDLRTKYNRYNLGISYYEISNITYQEADEILKIHLFDEITLTFKCKKTNNFNYAFKEVMKKIKNETQRPS